MRYLFALSLLVGCTKQAPTTPITTPAAAASQPATKQATRDQPDFPPPGKNPIQKLLSSNATIYQPSASVGRTCQPWKIQHDASDERIGTLSGYEPLEIFPEYDQATYSYEISYSRDGWFLHLTDVEWRSSKTKEKAPVGAGMGQFGCGGPTPIKSLGGGVYDVSGAIWATTESACEKAVKRQATEDGCSEP